MRTLLTLVLTAVALLLPCSTDAPEGVDLTPVAAVAYPNDPAPTEPVPVCPEPHLPHEGMAAPGLRALVGSTAAPLATATLQPAAREPCSGLTSPWLRASPPASTAGAVLCTELCISRR